MAPTTPLTIPLAILGLSLFAAVVSSEPNAPCYDPTGKWIPGYYPCDPTAYVTTCCQQGWTCFSSSLCVVTTHSNAFPNLTIGDVARGTCTNPLWADNICGDYCLDDANAKGEMAACGGDRFCCGHEFDVGTCNCSSNGGAFTLKPGRPQTILGVSGTSFTGSPTYASPTRYQTTSPTAASETTKAGEGSTGTRPTTSSPVTSPSTSPKPTSPSPSTSSPPSTTSGLSQNGTSDGSEGGNSRSLKIGLGVGIPLAVLAVAGGIVAYIVWHRRQRRDKGLEVGTAGWGTSDDLAENERAETPTLSRAAPPPMTQNRR